MTVEPSIRFLNVDLELVSATGLQPVIEYFESSGAVWGHSEERDGRWYGTFNCDCESELAEDHITRFVDLIALMPEAVRRCWNKMTKREFNAGYECGFRPRSYEQCFSSATLRRMADCGAAFSLTIYPWNSDYDHSGSR